VKVIGASDEQVDVFNEVWYNMLLNTGKASKGKISNFFSDVQTHESSSLTIMMKFITAIEVLEKQIKKRDGVPYLWRLLVRAALSLTIVVMVLEHFNVYAFELRFLFSGEGIQIS